jgi:hypothetical protein
VLRQFANAPAAAALHCLTSKSHVVSLQQMDHLLASASNC